MRHWQWMVALVVIRELPTRRLESVPAAMRDRAREHARSTKQERAEAIDFFEITKDLRS